MLEYRNTPIPNRGYSPTQLFMNRTLKSKLPTPENLLSSNVVDPITVQNNIKKSREKQKYYFDRTTRELEPLLINDKVTIQNGKIWTPGVVVGQYNKRSYLVQNEN